MAVCQSLSGRCKRERESTCSCRERNPLSSILCPSYCVNWALKLSIGFGLAMDCWCILWKVGTYVLLGLFLLRTIYFCSREYYPWVMHSLYMLAVLVLTYAPHLHLLGLIVAASFVVIVLHQVLAGLVVTSAPKENPSVENQLSSSSTAEDE